MKIYIDDKISSVRYSEVNPTDNEYIQEIKGKKYQTLEIGHEQSEGLGKFKLILSTILKGIFSLDLFSKAERKNLKEAWNGRETVVKLLPVDDSQNAKAINSLVVLNNDQGDSSPPWLGNLIKNSSTTLSSQQLPFTTTAPPAPPSNFETILKKAKEGDLEAQKKSADFYMELGTYHLDQANRIVGYRAQNNMNPLIAESNQNYQKGFEALAEAVKNGNIKAVQTITTSALNENSYAQYELAKLQLTDSDSKDLRRRLVDHNKERGSFHFVQAVSQGNSNALKYLIENPKEGYKWLAEAAKNSSAEALKLLQEATDSNALYHLGNLYLDGKTIPDSPDNESRGIELLIESMKQGNAEARNQILQFDREGKYFEIIRNITNKDF